MTILDAIRHKKEQRLSSAKALLPIGEIRAMAKDADRTRDFAGSIRIKNKGDLHMIGEIKKASPSKGVISKDFDHLAIAGLYERGPVSAVSVLTEEDFFQGKLSFLKEIKALVSKPLLRKDFIFDEYQIYESRAFGADAILLIASMLDSAQSKEYIHLAHELGIDVLYEVHNEAELERAVFIEAPIIGVNNRNLKDMVIDIAVSEGLARMIPHTAIKVSESGFEDRKDVERAISSGFDAILVGTAIMKASDRAAKMAELMGQ